MDREAREMEIDLLQIVRKLLENAKYIILATVIFGLIGYFGTILLVTPVYQASAKMIVSSRVDDSLNITNDQLNSARNLVETYAVIIRSRNVVNQVISELDLQEGYDQIVSSIVVKSVNNTPVMQINVKHTDKDTALRITEKLLDIAPVVLVNTAAAGFVNEVEQAYVGNSPVSPSESRNAVYTAIVGFIISCLIFVVLALLDNTYKTDIDIQKDLGLPVLGVIPELESCKPHTNRKKKNKGEETK